MRSVVVVILLLLSSAAFAAFPNIVELRALYYNAPSNKEAAEKFLKVMDQVGPEPEAILRCYKGMALMLKANHSYNPYNKLSYFNKGKAMVDEAVKQDPANTEIRFMRFCAQTNAPAFLGYNDNIKADKKIILGSWHKISDSDLKEKIKKYLVSSGHCTTEEKSVLL